MDDSCGVVCVFPSLPLALNYLLLSNLKSDLTFNYLLLSN